EGAAHLVVVARLEAELLVEAILGRIGPAEDVHGAHVPLLQRILRLPPGRVAGGEPMHPELAVPDVHLLFLEDALDGPRPRPVGALAHVLELVASPAV